MGTLLPIPTESLFDSRWRQCSHWSKSLCPFSLPQSQQPEGRLGPSLHDCASYRVVVSGFPKTAVLIYILLRIYQCPKDADHVSSLVNSDILFAGVKEIPSWGSWFPFNIMNGDHDFIHCISIVWKVCEEGRRWNWAEGKGKPKWPIRVGPNWAKVAKADIQPGSVLDQLPLCRQLCSSDHPSFLEGASGSHFPGSPLKASWKSPDESWDQSCIRHFPAVWPQKTPSLPRASHPTRYQGLRW